MRKNVLLYTCFKTYNYNGLAQHCWKKASGNRFTVSKILKIKFLFKNIHQTLLKTLQINSMKTICCRTIIYMNTFALYNFWTLLWNRYLVWVTVRLTGFLWLQEHAREVRVLCTPKCRTSTLLPEHSPYTPHTIRHASPWYRDILNVIKKKLATS